jgi:hypothetical protein
MWQCDHFVIFDAGHGFGRDHRIDDGFFGGLHGSSKDRLNFFVGQHFQIHDVVRKSSAGVGG